jgi:hypothetical protein
MSDELPFGKFDFRIKYVCAEYLNVKLSTLVMVLTQHKPWCFSTELQNETICNE